MTTTRTPVFRSPTLLVICAVFALSACDDPFANLPNVPDEPSEAILFDYVGSPLQDPPAFDVVGSRAVRVDQTTQWDFLFAIDNGEPQLMAFSVIADSVSQAGLQKVDKTFEEIVEAPEDGYNSETAIRVQEGDVFVVRSRRDRTQFLICNQYMKLEILDIELDEGTITFQYLRNPNCGDTVLQPGMHGEF